MRFIKLFPIYAMIFAISFSYVFSDDGEWDKVSNPYKIGKVEDVSIGYYQSIQHIYAATSTDYCCLWRSTDSGESWTIRFDVEDHGFNRVVIDPDSSKYGWTLVP